MPARSYEQFCALARALDHVGDRWTLLIVRELLFGSRSVRSLHDSLPKVSAALLSERLQQLCDDGLVARNAAPRRSKAVTYELTDAGAELEGVVMALVRFGVRWMPGGPGADHVDPAWSGLALKALLDDGMREAVVPGQHHSVPGDAIVHITADGETTTVQLDGVRRRVSYGGSGSADAYVTGSYSNVLALASGLVPFDDAELIVNGDSILARAAFGTP